MVIRLTSFLTCGTVAICLMSFLSCPVIYAQEMDSSSLSNMSSAAADTTGDSLEDSDIGAVEEFTLTPVPAVEPGKPPVWSIINARGEYQFNTSIDNAGDFSVARALAGIGLKSPLGKRFSIAVGAVYDFAAYDFDDSPSFDGGEPWGNINTGRFLIDVDYNINENWLLFGGGLGAIAAESGAEVSDSFTGGGFIGAGYRVQDSLRIRLGVSVISRIEDNVLVLPLFLADWTIDKAWRVRAAVLDTGSSDVVGAGVTYRINERLSLGAQAAYLSQRFRLDDSGFAPDGVGEDERFKGTLLLSYMPLRQVTVSAVGGVVFAGDLLVEDERGNRLFKEDYDPTPFVGARLALRF